MSEPTPVILLAFANDQGSYLQSLVAERKAIAGSLRSYEDSRFLRLQVEPNAGIDDLFALFDRFREQVAIFHYGGHANGAALNLETAGGGNEVAHAGGLAAMMGVSGKLKLVFLNGCATRDQVKALLAAGVPAVIATSVPIDDTAASQFAAQFYGTLGTGGTIGEAFTTASAKLGARGDGAHPVGTVRGMDWAGAPANPADDTLPWGLYTGNGNDDVLGWTLPKVAETDFVIQRVAMPGVVGGGGPEVNDVLVQALFNAVARYDDDVAKRLELARENNLDDDRQIRTDIVDGLPAPVGEHVRKLFSLEETDIARLRQLATAYEIAGKFVAFAIMSQVWNAKLANPALVITDEQWALIEAFRGLDTATEKQFDYVGLVLAGVAILEANSVFPFMAECATLPVVFGVGGAGAEAYPFLKGLRERLAAADPQPYEVPPLCIDAERHLATFLSVFAFLAGYKLATIKQISVAKSRNRPARFFHWKVVLDRVSNGFKDSPGEAAAFSDNLSVMLFKTFTNFGDCLNLTPFIIDLNAQRGAKGAQICFLRVYDAAGKAATYHLIEDPTQTFVISNDLAPADQTLFLPIRELVEEFREIVVKP